MKSAQKKIHPWRWIEAIPTLSAVLAEWQCVCGKEFEKVRPFLQPTNQKSQRYPCTHKPSCGCEHTVVCHDDKIVAACCCEASECLSFPLQSSDLIIYELNTFELCEAIRKAFGLENSCERGGWKQPRNFRSIGVFGPSRFLAKFICGRDEDGLLNEIEQMLRWPGSPFLFVSPTAQHHTEIIRAKLKRNGCDIIALSETMELLPDGRLKAVKSIEPILAGIHKPGTESGSHAVILNEIHQGFTAVRTDVRELRKDVKTGSQREPVDENVARQLFALVEQLELKTNYRKAPVTRVFQLYCLEGISRNAVAKKCKCAPSLITARLKSLEKTLGRPPSELRSISSHFDGMVDSFSDPRAKQIYRKGLIDEAEGEEEES